MRLSERDRLTERGLADPWRSDERDDRATTAPAGNVAGAFVTVEIALVAQFAHGEVLDDAFLHIVEAGVVGVEDVAGRGQIEVLIAALTPRKFEDAVEPVADPRLLRALLTRTLEPVDLTVDRGAHRVGKRHLGRLRPVVARGVTIGLAELLADRGQLLAQEVLALGLLHRIGDVAADLFGDFELLGPGHNQLEPSFEIDRLEHGELVLDIGVGPRGHRVGQGTRLGDGPQDFGEPSRVAAFGHGCHHRTEAVAQGTRRARRRAVDRALRLHPQTAALRRHGRTEAGPVQAAKDRCVLTVRKLADLFDPRHRADSCEAAVALVDEEHVAVDRPRDGRHSIVAFERERDDDSRKHDAVWRCHHREDRRINDWFHGRAGY